MKKIILVVSLISFVFLSLNVSALKQEKPKVAVEKKVSKETTEHKCCAGDKKADAKCCSDKKTDKSKSDAKCTPSKDCSKKCSDKKIDTKTK